jgi:lipopolysaccharide transport system permease protein
MIKNITEIFKYRELLYMFTWRDIRVKYKQSVMGFMWAILMPMLIISAGILVKYAMSTVSGKPMVVSDLVTVSVKALPWSFFVGSVRFTTGSLVGNSNLVTKIYFPKEIFPISAVLSNLFDFIIAAYFLVIILLIIQIGWSINLLWVPVLMTILIMLSVGLGMLLSALNLFFRDVKYIVEVVLSFGIFFTPVFYEVEIFHRWSKILLLNPVAPILEGLNASVVYHRSPDLSWFTYSVIVSCLLLGFGYRMFKKLEPAFAENI